MKALAQDPKARYQKARDLGKELSHFLFAYGEPVSDFDIESLVQGAMRERQRIRPPQASIIDKLIEEALLEFTSLKPDEAVGLEAKNKKQDLGGNSALNLGDFEDPARWLGEVQIADVPRPPTSAEAFLPTAAMQAGNLSALEDMDSEPSSDPSRGLPLTAPDSSQNPMLGRPLTSTGVTTSPAHVPASMSTPGQMMPHILPVASRAPEKKSSAMIGVIVAIAAVIAVAAGYFTLHH